jgi:hypothetical protein
MFGPTLMNSKKKCLCCQKDKVESLVDFGDQPPSNRFEQQSLVSTDRHRLHLGQCSLCGHIQLINPMPLNMVRSQFDWITYNEPEDHLDDLVARLVLLPNIHSGSRIIGLTYKDDTTIARLNKIGFANSYRYDLTDDLGSTDPRTGLESLYDLFADSTLVPKLSHQHGQADILIVRHVLEHVIDPVSFVSNLRSLVKPGGYLIFEVPDCLKFMGACDYTFIWEEHISYFCKSTLLNLVRVATLSNYQTFIYPFPFEDSLVAIAQNIETSDLEPHDTGRETEALRGIGQVFSQRFIEKTERTRAMCVRWKANQKKVAIFGAGHMATRFINFYQIADCLSCVIDDHEKKQAYLMPSSRLAIIGSHVLATEGIDICLLALSPESEQKVIDKHQATSMKGLEFFSITALSAKSIYKNI